MSSRFLIYGATGYSGKLIARTAMERALPAVVAGRDGPKIAALAQRLGLEGRAVGLDDSWRLEDALRDVDVVLNAAGPFARTASPLVDACLRTGTHYLDIAGEIGVFAEIRRRDAAARERGVMLMPGVGINVVASDCLAAHVVERLPGADRLRIGISRTPYVSPGSLQTVATLLADRVAVCRGGHLEEVPLGALEHDFDYGSGPCSSTALSWPDLFTAWLSTGVGDVEAYVQVEPWQRALLPLARASLSMWSSVWSQALLAVEALPLPEGPSYEDQKKGRRAVVVEAENRRGGRACARLRTPEGYWFSALASLAVVERVLAGQVEPGFKTPAQVYGAGLVLEIDGVYRDDL